MGGARRPPSGTGFGNYVIREHGDSSPIWYTHDPSLVKKAGFYPGLRQFLP